MKQFLFIFLFILGIGQAEAGRIMHVNCPFLLESTTPNLGLYTAEILENPKNSTTYNCIQIVQDNIHFGFRFASYEYDSNQIIYYMQEYAYLRVSINDEVTGIISFDDFTVTQKPSGLFHYDYLFSCPAPDTPVTNNTLPTFELKVELVIETSSSNFVPLPAWLISGVFLNFEGEGEPETEFVANVIPCDALELADRLGMLPGQESPKKTNHIDTAVEDLSVIPNPFNNFINVSSGDNELEFLNIELFDLAGRSLIKQNKEITGYETKYYTLDTSDLLPGVYVCKIRSNSFDKNIKLIKSKH